MTAQPLLERCSGSYTCKSVGSSETTRLALHSEVGVCLAGAAALEANHDVTTDAGSHQTLATWSGDSRAFYVCADGGCLDELRSHPVMRAARNTVTSAFVFVPLATPSVRSTTWSACNAKCRRGAGETARVMCT